MLSQRLFPMTALLLGIFSISQSSAQTTATDFTANDCSGISHQLFAELNDGKVVVICWVMPCGTCIAPALAASDAVKPYDNTHPGKVVYYMVDDYGNTACSTLNSWAAYNGILPDAVFSNSAISMSHYGADGMPKTVVIGGYDRKVFLNKNGSLTETALKTAIDDALVTASQHEKTLLPTGPLVYPNPVNTDVFAVELELYAPTDLQLEIRSMTGKSVWAQELCHSGNGQETFQISSALLSPGIYELRVSGAETTSTVKFVVD